MPHFNPVPQPTQLQETTTLQHDESGFRLELDEVRFGPVALTWGRYRNPQPKVIPVVAAQATVVSHFRLRDAAPRRAAGRLAEQEFVVYREPAGDYDFCLDPTTDQARTFFELSLSEELFSTLYTEESGFLRRFRQQRPGTPPALGFTAAMAPAMHGILHDMRSAPYHGHLRGVYLEAKAIELFLLQVTQLDQRPAGRACPLNARDVASLHEVKRYLEQHYAHPCPIVELAARAGLNQTKLKAGFKALFNTTVFGYLQALRLLEAKRLLLEENLRVGEVADHIGYQHPHHFTVAFKRKFGLLPSELKRTTC